MSGVECQQVVVAYCNEGKTYKPEHINETELVPVLFATEAELLLV